MISHFHFVFALLAAIIAAYISFTMVVRTGRENPIPQLRTLWRNAFYNQTAGKVYFILSIKAAFGLLVIGTSYTYGWFLVSYFMMATLVFIAIGHLIAAFQGYGDFRSRRNCYR